MIDAQRLKEEISIVNLYSGQLRRSGNALVGLCPFHADSHPSLALYPDTNSFFCFACGETGDAISFYMKIKKVDFKTAVKELIDFAGLDPETFISADNISKLKTNENKDEEATPIHIPNLTEFLNEEFGEIPWLVEELIPSGGSGIIVARRGSYKTWLALYFSYCISKGLPLWGLFKTTKTNVLYISNDDPVKMFQARLGQFEFDDAFYVYHNNLPKFSIDTDNGSFEAVKHLIKDKGVGLLIIDIVRNTHNRDSGPDKDAKIVLDRYKELRASNPNLVFIFIFHPSKETLLEKRFGKRDEEEAVGSYFWEAAVDTVLSLTRTTENEIDKVFVKITKNKQSLKLIKPFMGIRRESENSVEFVYEEKIPETLKIDEAKSFIRDLLPKGKYHRKQIIEITVASGICAARTVEEAIKELINTGEITHTDSRPYVYSLVSNDQSQWQESTLL